MSQSSRANQKQTVLLVVYGEGGHYTEMGLLLKQFGQSDISPVPLNIVSLGVGKLKQPVVAHYPAGDIRNKYSRIKSLLNIIPVMFGLLYSTIKITRRYKLNGVMATGPGICILPMVVLRLMGVKTVYIETWCRFNTRSLTGRVMSKIAHRFLVQDKQLLALYPNAEYCGRI